MSSLTARQVTTLEGKHSVTTLRTPGLRDLSLVYNRHRDVGTITLKVSAIVADDDRPDVELQHELGKDHAEPGTH
jgi:hypothetical protein